jgi:hypothetical protein
MITNLEQPWTPTERGFCTEASEYHQLPLAQKVTPCCKVMISKRMMQPFYVGIGEDQELGGHRGECTCGKVIIIFND